MTKRTAARASRMRVAGLTLLADGRGAGASRLFDRIEPPA
jgi:hypothetical protein